MAFASGLRRAVFAAAVAAASGLLVLECLLPGRLFLTASFFWGRDKLASEEAALLLGVGENGAPGELEEDFSGVPWRGISEAELQDLIARLRQEPLESEEGGEPSRSRSSRHSFLSNEEYAVHDSSASDEADSRAEKGQGGVSRSLDLDSLPPAAAFPGFPPELQSSSSDDAANSSFFYKVKYPFQEEWMEREMRLWEEDHAAAATAAAAASAEEEALRRLLLLSFPSPTNQESLPFFPEFSLSGRAGAAVPGEAFGSERLGSRGERRLEAKPDGSASPLALFTSPAAATPSPGTLGAAAAVGGKAGEAGAPPTGQAAQARGRNIAAAGAVPQGSPSAGVLKPALQPQPQPQQQQPRGAAAKDWWLSAPPPSAPSMPHLQPQQTLAAGAGGGAPSLPGAAASPSQPLVFAAAPSSPSSPDGAGGAAAPLAAAGGGRGGGGVRGGGVNGGSGTNGEGGVVVSGDVPSSPSVPGAGGGGAGAAGGPVFPHEFYAESKASAAVRGLKWIPDPRVLQPELLQPLVVPQSSKEGSKDRASWAAMYGFRRPVEVFSSAKRQQTFVLEFVDVLGAGGFGLVLSAVDVTNNREVAVKICRLKKHNQRGLHADQAQLSKRVNQEINIWKFVPPGIDSDQWSAMSHLVMPLDVVEPVEKIKPQGPDQILYSFEWVVFEVFAGDLEHMDLILAGNMPARVEAAKQIIFATMNVHAVGLVHSDVKLLNFFIRRDGRIFLGDHSLCRPGYQNIACMDGTLHYLPPENMRCQLYHKKRIITSERKDTWAVGVVLFRLFCGSLPFDMRDLWSADLKEAVGYANANDLDFTQCHPDTPLLILGLIRLLLNPNVTSRPTLRDVYIHHPLFAMSDEAIASGKKARDVQEAVVREDPSLAVFIKPSRSK